MAISVEDDKLSRKVHQLVYFSLSFVLSSFDLFESTFLPPTARRKKRNKRDKRHEIMTMRDQSKERQVGSSTQYHSQQSSSFIYLWRVMLTFVESESLLTQGWDENNEVDVPPTPALPEDKTPDSILTRTAPTATQSTIDQSRQPHRRAPNATATITQQSSSQEELHI